MTQIQDYLKTFDHRDRYDSDGDGDFNETDGYIDHFQIVHAGGDEADGDRSTLGRHPEPQSLPASSTGRHRSRERAAVRWREHR